MFKNTEYRNNKSKIDCKPRIRGTLFRSRESGQSLVSVLVAVGIMGIVVIGLASMMSMQQKETRALSEKLAALDFTRTITATLANPSLCSALLAATNVGGGAASLTFDATNVTSTTPQVINLTQIAGITNGGIISPLSSSLLVATNGVQLAVTSPSAANVLVNFDQTKLVRPLKALSFPIFLQSSGAIGNTTITGCAGSGGAALFPVGLKCTATAGSFAGYQLMYYLAWGDPATGSAEYVWSVLSNNGASGIGLEGLYITFGSGGIFTSEVPYWTSPASATDCNGKSLSQLKAAGKTFGD